MSKSRSASKIVMKDTLELFKSSEMPAEGEHLVMLPLLDLHTFPNHPYKVRDDEKMDQLVESIKENGVLTPGIAIRREEGGYYIVSGHSRTHACEIIGLSEMPFLVKEIDMDEAVVMMVDSNLQREQIDFSEKAFAYRMKRDALEHRGKKSDKSTATSVGEEAGDSARQVLRFIRLTELIEEMLLMVDQKKLSFNAGVGLSFLSVDEQRMLLRKMEQFKVIPNLIQASSLKNASMKGELNESLVDAIFSNNLEKSEKVSFEKKKIAHFFASGTSKEEMEATIYELLKEWKERRMTNG